MLVAVRERRRLRRTATIQRDCNHRRTGFSRERVIRHTAKSTVHTPASSRLKPVPQKHRDQPVGPALAGKASVATPEI